MARERGSTSRARHLSAVASLLRLFTLVSRRDASSASALPTRDLGQRVSPSRVATRSIAPNARKDKVGKASSMGAKPVVRQGPRERVKRCRAPPSGEI